jgi:hypothetical protein
MAGPPYFTIAVAPYWCRCKYYAAIGSIKVGSSPSAGGLSFVVVDSEYVSHLWLDQMHHLAGSAVHVS